ncbi:MAG: NAD(P)/FAD-dependent oxidoreductase [Firmicutes bacterium]|nr:NAD(P)/FAD-dependent oxidoreductase [Bacillota bacterium]
MKYDVIVIGAGAAGMLAAGKAAQAGARTLLLEKNEKVGRKIGITGKGRCNVTNACDDRTFMTNIISNPRFLYSALDRLSSQDVMDLLEENKVKLKVERGNRVFPVSDRSFDIIDGLLRFAKKAGAKVQTGETMLRIIPQYENAAKPQNDEDGAADKAIQSPTHFLVQTDKQMLEARAVILTTGGLSYPVTGSNGDGHRVAKALGVDIVPGVPGLIPLTTKETWCKDMMGVSLKNTGIRITLGPEGKTVYEDFGEMLFTHFGVSGPMILSAASHLQAYLRKKKQTFAQADFCLHIDLKTGLDSDALDLRLQRDFEKYNTRNFGNALDDLLPRKMIPVMVKLTQIPAQQKVSDISKEQRRRLGRLLKDLRLTVTGTRPLEEAIVTMGGIAVKEVQPSTMMIKKVPGLFAAGELLDIDALTGGFNLQLAFSTGAAAGEAAAEYAMANR